MSKKIILLLFLIYLASSLSALKAQNLYVDFKNGIESARQIGSIQKLTFVNNKLVFNYISGTSEVFSISNIQKISFVSAFTSVDDINTNNPENKISVFPNPVSDQLSFKNLPQGISELYIYRMDGALLIHTQINENVNSVDLSALSVGIYLIRVNNQIIKICKI